MELLPERMEARDEKRLRYGESGPTGKQYKVKSPVLATRNVSLDAVPCIYSHKIDHVHVDKCILIDHIAGCVSNTSIIEFPSHARSPSTLSTHCTTVRTAGVKTS